MDRRLLRLTFDSHNVGEPVVYQLGIQFGLTPNILRANIGKTGGWALLELVGGRDELEAAIAWAASRGVLVEEIAEELVD